LFIGGVFQISLGFQRTTTFVNHISKLQALQPKSLNRDLEVANFTWILGFLRDMPERNIKNNIEKYHI